MSERDSLRNLSAAITARQRSEAEAADAERGALLERVLALDLRLAELLRALAAAARAPAPAAALALALRFVVRTHTHTYALYCSHCDTFNTVKIYSY